MLCALGITLALHCTAGARHGAAVRVLAAGALPALATTLYLTFSRGGLVAALLGIVVYAVVAHPRRLPLALLAAGLPTAVAVKAAYDADGLATGELVAGEGQRVALVVLACTIGAIALRALGCLADRRIDAISVSPRARRLAWAGMAVATCAVLVATDVPQRLDDQRREFLEVRSVGSTGDQRDRLDEAAASGRIQHWDVARATFREHSLTGTGAGTYRLEWERERDIPKNVADAHSLYLEIAAELGMPGLVLLAAGAARAARGRRVAPARGGAPRPRGLHRGRRWRCSCTPGSTGTGRCRRCSCGSSPSRESSAQRP